MNNQHTLFDLPQANRCTVTIEGSAIVLKTPWDPAAVAGIKNLPYSDRKWDPARKAWLVSVSQAKQVEQLLEIYFGEEHHIQVQSAQPVQEARLLECHYIGTTKDRDNGEKTAFGMDAKSTWAFIFPELVLKSWFEIDPDAPSEATTLYGVLNAKKDASSDELKTAFRRLALQWHPDKCREANATEVFRRIQEAYSILSITGKRARYDAGLALEKTLGKQEARIDSSGYRSPLRCGYIMATGVQKLDRFLVEVILGWEDISNSSGQILVVSWSFGADAPQKVWA